MTPRDTFLALLVPIVLGFGFVIAKPAMESFPPLLLNGLRWSSSGLIMFYFFPFPKKLFKKLIIISFVGCTLQYGLSYSGLNIIDGTSATLFVQAEIRGRQVDQVIRLPRSAMRDNNQVLVVGSDDRIHFRQVSLVRQEHDDILISDGLEGGELVSISAMQAAVDGMLVKPVIQ